MSTNTIMLAKDYDFRRVIFPVCISEKLDGVPAKFFKDVNGKVVAMTRQGELLTSVEHICKELSDFELLNESNAIVGELWVRGRPFKETSGKVRADGVCTDLKLYIYDEFFCDKSGLPSDSRTFRERWSHIKAKFQFNALGLPPHVYLTKQITCANIDIFNFEMKCILAGPDDRAYKPEGVMVRMLDGDASYYSLTGRSWGMMRIVEKPTLDLMVVEVVEAKAKDGTPKGMVGSFMCKYHDIDIKVGAGKATHNERKKWWQRPELILGTIIQVQYKPDDSYSKLRQPTFQRVRTDKDTPDA